MADTAAGYLGLDPQDVASITILPEPTNEVVDGMTILHAYGGATPIRVEVTLTNGSTLETAMCSGIPSGPACTNDPHIATRGVDPGSGYRDVPCPGDPSTCPTPLPSLDAKAVAAAKPIAIERLDVPIDHVGAYEVDIGEGSLPNGILSRASFALGDDWPEGVTITDASIWLEVRSLEPDGKPFQNYYEHGWQAGTERIRAVLVFRVTRFDPGAVLQVRDILVR